MQPQWLSPDVVDLAAVRRWGEGAGLAGPITDVRRIGGGTQNVVLRLRWDRSPWTCAAVARQLPVENQVFKYK